MRNWRAAVVKLLAFTTATKQRSDSTLAWFRKSGMADHCIESGKSIFFRFHIVCSGPDADHCASFPATPKETRD